MLAVIGGTGFYSLGKKLEERDVMTPYGPATLQLVSLVDEKLVFLPRYGRKHLIPPHRVNYRANIAALEKAGVTGVITTYAAGILSKYKPGDLVLLDDFMGLWNPTTFFDDFSAGAKHVDFSAPFSKEMKAGLREVAAVGKTKLKSGGIIATTRGPRFETKTEAGALKKLGANLVNMSAAYELALLGESEIDCAAIAVATNYATGMSKKPPSHEETLRVMRGAYGSLMALIGGFAEEVV